jgi:hypothetical protein
MLDHLREGMTENAGSLGSHDSSALFPTTLESLVVLSPGWWCRRAYLNGLVEASRVVVVERAWDQAGQREALMQWEKAWIDGINGGMGFWDLSDRYITET